MGVESSPWNFDKNKVQSNSWARTLAKNSTQFSGRGEQVCEYRETFLFREMLIWRLLGDAAASKKIRFKKSGERWGLEERKKLEKKEDFTRIPR
jgi:hypothetical protein